MSADAAALTAVLPVKEYHRDYLREALGSVMRQTAAAWRLVIVAEPDLRAELSGVLGRFLADPRVELAANEGRRLAGALNTGMRRAGTAFVAILLGDDLWAPTAVEVLTRAIAVRPDVDFFHSSRMIVDDEGRPISSVHEAPRAVTLADFERSSPVKHLLCWRRELALSFGGFDESLGSAAVDDFDFPWSMAERGARFEAIADCLYLYRDHRSSFRLTTHLPLGGHRRQIARIMAKHGVPRAAIERRLAAAEASYLRQCLYRSRLDRWLKELRGVDARLGWRETYR